jgi:disulfide bond formation protein DsbB
MFSRRNLIYSSWVISLLATFGSLYFSEILKYQPCVLCWYQRIFMYPLALILPIGLLLRDKNLHLYVLPLSIFGVLVSFYQNLLYYGFISQAASPCTIGVSCTARFIKLGFLDIPQLSLISFAVITILMLIYRKAK